MAVCRLGRSSAPAASVRVLRLGVHHVDAARKRNGSTGEALRGVSFTPGGGITKTTGSRQRPRAGQAYEGPRQLGGMGGRCRGPSPLCGGKGYGGHGDDSHAAIAVG